MSLPDFNEHRFQPTGVRMYRCVRCDMDATETEQGFEFTSMGYYSAVSKRQKLDDSKMTPSCVPKKRLTK